jgi:ribosomal protein S27AE
MKATPAPAKGEPCPQCGDEFIEARQLTPEEHAQLTDRDNPRHFPGFVDTAPPKFIAEHGTLAKCGGCGYQTRFAPEAEGDPPANGDAATRDRAPRAGARGRTT